MVKEYFNLPFQMIFMFLSGFKTINTTYTSIFKVREIFKKLSLEKSRNFWMHRPLSSKTNKVGAYKFCKL